MTNLRGVRCGDPPLKRWWGILVVLWLAFGLRLVFLLGSARYVDEYITLLAVRAVNQLGYPRLPSGTFYTHGLPFTYVDAGFWAILGSSTPAARFPALLFGVAAVALVYRMGQRWFSHRVGLYAATILASTTTAVIWGARVRMYTLQQFCFLLAVFELVEGVCRNRRVYRLVGGLAAVVAVLCHPLTLVFLLAFALGVVLALGTVRRFRVRSPVKVRALWPEAIVVTTGLCMLLAMHSVQGPWSTSGRAQASLETLLDAEYLASHLLAGFHPFIVFPDLILTLFFFTGSLFVVLRLVRRRFRSGDVVYVLLWATFLAGMLAVALFLTFKEDRYVLPLVPLYGLVVACELDFVRQRLLALARRGWLRRGLECLVWVALACLMIPTAARVAVSNPVLLDCAWSYVKAHWQGGDAVATIMPAVAYEWLGQVDYFAMETGYEAVETGSGMVDIWIGAPLVDSPERMQEAIAGHHRLWLVMDERAWDWFYSDAYRSVIETEMHLVSECPGMRVYVSGH